MLVIREIQMRALARVARTDLAMDHVREFFPSKCDSFTRLELQDKVARALDRAGSHELHSMRDQLQFVDLVFILGEDFDMRFCWASAILNDRSPETFPLRASLLYDRSLQFLRSRRDQQDYARSAEDRRSAEDK
jgi:hypothetical protein